MVAKNAVECLSCNDGWVLKVSNDGTNCIKLEDPNCIEFQTVSPFSCIKCLGEYYPDTKGVCVLR